ncbi:transcription initiation factor TFIID subunit 12 isoform X2 [Macrobrachium rosenbergii]|uniref:transcription initiation factor TFIID subunit 12 isoform X2 n=1 Tax=Macrobrachium rosenbergii TaxID=79674 RepID=UPI0034D4941E
MSQPVQQVVGGQVVQGQMVQVQGQVVSGTQVVNSAGQVVMSTTAGLTGISGQQIMTHLVPSQAQVVHQASTPVGVTTTLASAIPQTQQVVSGQSVGVQQVVQGQQIQAVSNHVGQTNMVAAATTTQVKTPVQNQSVPAPDTSINTSTDTPPVLSKQRITELVREVDPNEQLEEEVEDMLLSIADDFIESTVNAACRLAQHRGARSLDVKDVQMYLERNWHMWIPGFGTDELRPYKRAPTTEAHKQRLALIRKAIKKY